MDPEKTEEEIFAAGAPDAPEDDANEDEEGDEEDLETASVEEEQDRH